ncbi:MAG: acetyl-CoA hydrolase [Kineosporiaceae bacterium]|nr:acetyl-CoA hydrolase [Kineosporiaceae bacterium]
MRTIEDGELATILSQVAQRRAPNPPRLVVSGNVATPWSVLRQVDQVLEQYSVYLLNGQRGLPQRPGVTLETSFVGPGMRGAPNLRYVPTRLSLVPRLFSSSLVPDVVVVHTSPPHNGRVSLGIEVNILPSAIDAARLSGGVVIAQVNSHMPYTFGNAEIDVDEIDYAIEADEPLPELTMGDLDETSQAIGELITARVRSGSTLQLGIGGVPDAVVSRLTQHRDMRVWTEMFSDGVLALERAGCMDPTTPLTASFLIGTADLYTWVHRNPRVQMLRTEVTNEPANIARHPNMVSVNTALQVDLFAQANASRIKGRIYSGFGGQTDFIVGALHSDGGQAFIALRSWHPKADVSTIVPLIEEPLTSFQPSAVVTEHGVAEIRGQDDRTQARNLIENAAHPRIREELWEEAYELGLT